MSSPSINLNNDEIGLDSCRALISAYESLVSSKSQLNAKVTIEAKARSAVFMSLEFPSANALSIAAQNSGIELARRHNIRDALDIQTLMAAFSDFVFGTYAHHYGLITDPEFDLLTRPAKGILY